MSYVSEHRRMKPVLDKARELDVTESAAPDALFEPGNSGFLIWCTPDDHPIGYGWDHARMIQGTYAQKCAYVAQIYWEWADDGGDDSDKKIVSINLSTDAYAVRDYWVSRGIHAQYNEYTNTYLDVQWAIEKTRQLFELAGVECPPINVKGYGLPIDPKIGLPALT